MSKSLKEMIESGFGVKEGFNCSEKMVRGAAIAYGLDLSEDALRLMSGFGGGMGLGETCGTISGAVAVLSFLLVRENAHSSPELKPATQEFITLFQDRLGSTTCRELRPRYRTKESGCDFIIITAAGILDDMVKQIKEKKTS